MKELKDFEHTVMVLEKLTATILSSEKGFAGMSKMLKEDLAGRLQRVSIYLLFSKGMKTGSERSRIRPD